VRQALAAELRSLREVFRSPGLRGLQLAGFGTSVGQWGSALLLEIYAFEKGGASAVGLMALLRVLPGAPAAPLLTFLADRQSRRSVLIATNAVRATAVGGAAIAVAAGAPIAVAYGLVAVLAVASPAYGPAQAALVPLLARTPSELTSANLAASTLSSVGFLIGSLAAGVLLPLSSLSLVIALSAGAFALSLVPLMTLERDTPPAPDPDQRPMREVAEGFETVAADHELRLHIGVGGIMALTLGALDVLVVVAALGFLHIGQAGAGYLNAAWGLGAVAGGAAMVALLARGRLALGLVLGATVIGASSALIGAAATAVVAFIAIALVGVGETLVEVVGDTLLQRLTPDHLLSRVFGVVESVGAVMLALGSLGAGLLANAIGARGALIAVGALLPVVVLLGFSRLSRDEARAPVPGREYGLLRAHPIFAPLSAASAERLARSLVEVRPPRDAVVVRQGDVGDRFYLVVEGLVDVLEGGVHKRTLAAGEGFGEIALLRDVRRTATVRARGDVVLLALDRDTFLEGVTGLSRSKRSADSVAEERITSVAPVEAWLEAVKGAARRGELLSAVDVAEQGLAEYPDELWLKHGSVLALARAGATEEAGRRFERHGLAASREEEIAALGARIAKDLALAAHADQRTIEAARARDLYEAIYRRTRGYYPAINAATLSLLAEEPDRARELATVVLKLLRSGRDASYYAAATEGEAHLLLGDVAAARDALERAAASHGGDHGALATTRRQLRLVCGLAGIDSELVGILAGPGVVHYCGHRISAVGSPGRFPATAEADLAGRIEAEIARQRPGYGYGALASGADILWAEALLRHEVELHVVLPFARDEFVESSVASSGPVWIERFERCLAAAATVSYATDDAYLGDDVLYRYGSELAMGLALLRARYLDADVRQLAVWDGGPALGQAGTAIDVATWRRSEHPITILEPIPGEAAPPPGSATDQTFISGRVVRTMLFADVVGFSKLTDEQLPRFATHVLGAFAAVLDRYGDQVLHRNTWGDAVYAVLTDPGQAAECALELQAAVAAIDLQATGLPSSLALRLGAHVGPVFPTHDPVLGRLGFMGSHVSRTARLEPVTPPGEVYVTEQFAAALELDRQHPFACDYVGHLPAAKEYGNLRMYRLHRTT